MRNRKIVRKYDHVDRHDLEQGESVFHTANGYIGIRGAFEEGYCCDVRSVRGCYINGVYDITSMSQADSQSCRGAGYKDMGGWRTCDSARCV